jgi:hypothetical protein
VKLPALSVWTPGSVALGQSYRFLADGTGLLYAPRAEDTEFWMLNLATGMTRQIAKLALSAEIRFFDVTPDGKQILFDRVRENTDIVLIERKQAAR